MGVKVIIFVFSASLCFYSSVVSAVQHFQDAPTHKQIHQGNYARDIPVENSKMPLPQFNLNHGSLNHQHVYQQNNKPIKPPLNIVQNQPLPVREGIQINQNLNIQQKNLRPYNTFTNGINERNLHFQQKPQTHIMKFNENQHFSLPRIRNPPAQETPFKREVAKNAAIPMVHQPVAKITKTTMTNIHERGSVSQKYNTNFVPVHNRNNVTPLGNNNYNVNQQRHPPVQQPVPNKRYTFIKKNGDIEYYDSLEEILRKYPLIKLPTYLRQVTSSPIADVNKNLETNKSHFTSFQKQSLQNTAKLPGRLQNDRHAHYPEATKMKFNHEMPNNIPKKSAIDIIQAETHQNKASNAKTNLRTVKAEPNEIYPPRPEILPHLTNKVIEKSSTNLLSTNVSNLEKSEIFTTAPEVNKIEKPLNFTVFPKIIPENKEHKATESMLPRHAINSTDIKDESKNKLNPKNTAINTNLLNSQKLVKKELETNNTNIENGLSTPPNTLNVKNSVTASNNLNTEGKQKNILEKTTRATKCNDSNEDSWLPNKPVMWFRTDDEKFWEKLVDDRVNSNVYIINVQSHPKIEKDTKTIVHANGTIVEEITESVWEDDCDEPKITKTVKITQAADITKDKIVVQH